MEPVYRVESIPKASSTALLPGELLDAVGLGERVWLEFGTTGVSVRVAPTRHKFIGLAAHLVKRLRIPDDLCYRARGGGRSIRLGPVIGILAGNTRADMAQMQKVRALANHLVAEPGRGGLFYVFDTESVDLVRAAVRGYRLLPDAEETWEEGEFPLPQVIFRRYGAGLGTLADPLRALGVKVFNERTFHKGEAARWMAEDGYLRSHLPETVKLAGVPSVLDMLARHGSVYIKPVWGSQAVGILRVRREGGGFEVAPSGLEAIRCPNQDELAAVLKPLLPGNGIVQQGIALARAGGRLLDFRVVLQKDGRGCWGVSGIVARCGVVDRPVTNISAGGFPLSVDEALGLLFGSLPTVLFRRRQDLIRLSLAVGKVLDQTGSLIGDLGVDVAYDQSGNLWIIEVNNRDPNHTIGLDVGDWPGFLRFRTLPMAFASHLAGFGPR